MRTLTLTSLILLSSISFGQELMTLEEGESVKLTYESQGCFHQTSDEITFYRLNGYYYFNYGLTKPYVMSEQQKKLVSNFEIELKAKKSNGCTTLDEYRVQFNGKTKKYIDGSCSWSGWSSLMKGLGLKESK